MIRAMIAGADSPVGGELIRLLVHHPDVVVTAAYAPEYTGIPVATYHCGLAGDTDLCFTDIMAANDGDVLFIANDYTLPFDPWAPGTEHLRIIDLSGQSACHTDMVPGICELNRKAMVRGARMVRVPDARATLLVTTLMPLAKAQLLGKGCIKLQAAWGTTDANALWRTDAVEALQTLQPEWDGAIEVSESASENKTYGITLTIPTDVAMTQIQSLYADAFEDHNFTHMLPAVPTAPHVLNSMKCLIHLGEAEDSRAIIVSAMLDPVVKGGAGNAVHAMNLLFGLQESTGLRLKAMAH